MCGHVGIAGNLEFKDEATIRRLLIYDYFRGPDSTGIAVINKEGNDAKIVKIASHPLDLFDMTKFKAALSSYQSSVFLGHNRAATKGVVNNINAHPYEFDHIIGAHNGTLSAATFAKLNNKLGEKFEVDSQAIFASIAKFGIEATVEMFQESVEGTQCPDAWALVWFDLKEGTLNFLRNKERPFWYAYSKEFDRVFWASEWPMIDAAVKLSVPGYQLHTDPEKGYRFWQTPENVHFKFDIDKLRAGSETKPKPVAKELKGKAPAPVVTTAATGTSPFPRHNRQGSGSGSGGATTSTTTSRGTLLGNVAGTFVHLFGNKTAPFAGFITEEKFAEIAKYGCSWCGADVDFDEVGVTVFEKDETVLCPSCSGGAQGHSRVYTTNLEEKLRAAN